jgi:hypothetical protein
LRKQGERERIRDKLRREKEHRPHVSPEDITDMDVCDAEIIRCLIRLTVTTPSKKRNENS